MQKEKQTCKALRYNWSSIAYCDIINQYKITERDEFYTLKETSERHTPKDEYENFVSTHIETTVQRKTTKLRVKCNFLGVNCSSGKMR